LHQLPSVKSDRLIVGAETLDDAGVVRLTSDLALVQTLDFFPPVVDDPVWFGRIAAANALSDVYAMGGTPMTAMNIVGWPQELPPSVLAQVLRGGAEKIAEAGAILVGGHSVRDKEVKYGLSVTGTVHPDRITTNAGARVGDVLVLTKPLGMGAAATAMKLDKLPPEWIEPACMQMAHLNKGAAEAAATVDCKAATDVTGFGLMGHGRGMAEASGVTLEFVAAALPLFPVALELAAQKLTSGGATRTRAFLGATAEIGPGVDPLRALLAFDAETSGGMLICVAEDRVERLLRELAAQGTPCAAVVGRVVARQGEVRVRLI
jgi:selenide,water dikinase